MRNSTLEDEFGVYRVGCMPVNNSAAVRILRSSEVHPSAVIGENAEWVGRRSDFGVVIGERCIIRPFVTIDRGVDRDTTTGNDNLIMAHVHIGHDVRIGDRCQIAPHASIGGCVTIGNDVKIGMGVVIRPHVTVGDGARLGMGAVVTKDVPPGEVWVGNPARKLAK